MANILSFTASGTEAEMRERINRIRHHTFPLLWSVVPRSALRYLPSTSEKFGPPRASVRWADYKASEAASWRSVIPEWTQGLPPPFFCNSPQNPLAQGLEVTWPESGVAEIEGGRVLDEHAWVVAPGDRFLGDFCYMGDSRFSKVYHIIKLHPPRKLPGRTLNLCSANAVTNFFHFVIDAVSRVELVQRAGYTWEDFDQILFPRFSSPTTEAILDAAGLPREKLLRIGRREQFVCETLIQPSFPGPVACTPPWVLDFYRQLFPSAPTQRTRRLYLPRYNNRYPADEAAIANRLAAAGFETVDPAVEHDLPQMLAEASHVVGVHGASLANLVFCAPGTRVLEIMPTEISEHYNRWFYYTLASSGDMPYGVLIGRSLRQRLTPFSPQPKTEFVINPSDLDAALDALLAD